MIIINIINSGCALLVLAGVRYVPDTDDEKYENEETEDSDSSDDSNTSENKDDKSAVATLSKSSSTASSQLKRHLSDSADELNEEYRTASASSSSHRKDGSAVDHNTVAVDTSQVKRLDDEDDVDGKQTQSLADRESVDKKRRKLDDGTSESASDVNSHGTCKCSDHSTWVCECKSGYYY